MSLSDSNRMELAHPKYAALRYVGKHDKVAILEWKEKPEGETQAVFTITAAELAKQAKDIGDQIRKGLLSPDGEEASRRKLFHDVHAALTIGVEVEDYYSEEEGNIQVIPITASDLRRMASDIRRSSPKDFDHG